MIIPHATPKPSEEPFGLEPPRTGITQPHQLQWIDPTFDEAEPSLNNWMRGKAIDALAEEQAA